MPNSSLDCDRLVRETFVARVEHHATVGSTNDLAKELAANGRPELPLLVIADQQTAGRGRGNNRWWTGGGSLAFSLLFDMAPWEIDRQRALLVAFAPAIAVVETLAPLVAPRPIGLHWPNDVFIAGRKLAGILTEVTPNGLYVVGVGINTNSTVGEAPVELRRTAVTLHDLTGCHFEHSMILVGILRRFEQLLRMLQETPERLAEQAALHCLQRGLNISIRSQDRVITGVCAGIAADGALLIDTPTGRETIYSGVAD
jgi:BirA family transcriptional regulator, biotin operon repressor / biotin---[acetyl-CoA-carboxylase] ligase